MDATFHPVPKPVSPAKDRSRKNRRNGKEAERAVGKKLGGYRVPMSGAGTREKGDVKVEELPQRLFVEVKRREPVVSRGKESFTIQREWLEKTWLDAEAAGEIPLVALRFANREETYYVVPDRYLELLVAQLKQFYAEARG